MYHTTFNNIKPRSQPVSSQFLIPNNVTNQPNKPPPVINTVPLKIQPNDLKPLLGFSCNICYQRRDLYKFAQCIHKIACLECLQQIVNQSLSNKQIPQCYFSNCGKKMISKQGSAFTFFNDDLKKKYFRVMKIISANNQNRQAFQRESAVPCRVINCDGVISLKNNTCVQCNTLHCSKCWKIHEGTMCLQLTKLQTLGFTALGLKKCPNCFVRFQKQQGGCNKFECKQCKHQFCVECYGDWQIKHHMCGDIPLYRIPYLWLMETCGSSNQVKIQKQNEKQIDLNQAVYRGRGTRSNTTNH